MTVVTGLDLSLTSSGLARVTFGKKLDSHVIELDTVKSEGHEGDTLRQRAVRIRTIANQVNAFVRGSDLVVIEQPSYGSKGGHAHDRSGVWWGVVGWLHAKEIPVVEIAPTARMKYITGKGIAGKDDIVRAIQRIFKGNHEVEAKIRGLSDNDKADALGGAGMGTRYLGYIIDGDRPIAAMDTYEKYLPSFEAVYPEWMR